MFIRVWVSYLGLFLEIHGHSCVSPFLLLEYTMVGCEWIYLCIVCCSRSHEAFGELSHDLCDILSFCLISCSYPFNMLVLGFGLDNLPCLVGWV